REVVGQLLAVHGHTVALAESGERAWEELQDWRPDALVVDQRLPGITGLDLLRRMRQTPGMEDIPVVLCSADDSERDAASLAGACDFWLKGSEGMFDAVA